MTSWTKGAEVVVFLQTDKPQSSKIFYRDTLGFGFSSEDSSALVFDCGGTMLRIGKVDSFKPSPYTVLGWSVPDIKEAVQQLKDKGIAFNRYDGLDFDTEDICTFRNDDRVAWFNDPDSNLLSITQFINE